MSLNISSQILRLPGQCVKQVQDDLERQSITVTCARDRRFPVIERRPPQLIVISVDGFEAYRFVGLIVTWKSNQYKSSRALADDS